MTERRYSLGGAGRDYNPYNTREPVLSPEAKAERDAASKKLRDNFLREVGPKWGVKPEDMDLFINDSQAYRQLLDRREAQSRGLTKIVDAEARVAVEGDTDLNHDNLEG